MEQQVYTTVQTARDYVLREEPIARRQASPVAVKRASSGYLVAKRLLDLLGSLFGLLVLFPVFALIAVLVRRDSAGPIFHRRRVLEQQDYQGSGPQTFDAFKIRTMIADADEYLRKNPHLMQEFQQAYKLRQDPRITPLGQKLRTTSLDELPQLVNVLRGQMSLVGPRMISPPELEMYGEHAQKLLSVKPGMTGLWQVSGRQHVSYQERVRLDMEYIDNRSLLLDLQILMRTVWCVLLRKGAF